MYSQKKGKSNKSFHDNILNSYERTDETDKIVFNFSVDTELFSSKNSEKKWDDITQEEINSVKCHGDNMNLHEYKIRATYIPTKRTRTIKIYAQNETDALLQLDSDYVKESATVSLSEYPPPTEHQIKYALYLGISIPEKCCQYDLSTLIDQHTDEPAPANLIEYATSRNLRFSYYADEPYLIRLIASQMDLQEWIAFALICMEKHISKKWNFSNWNNYMAFSLKCIDDTSFMKSLEHARLYRHDFWGFDYGDCAHNSIFFRTLLDHIQIQGST